MLRGAAENTEVILYLMAAAGGMGAAARIVNMFTLCRLVKASREMSKSTHKLIKLIGAQYEDSCMAFGPVKNTNVFIEKYIYEYRGFLFHIHTWRQIGKLSPWFVGILAVFGASAHYVFFGADGVVYQYILSGAAGIALLSVMGRIFDEPYRADAAKMYMTDYLDNICAPRLKRRNEAQGREMAGNRIMSVKTAGERAIEEKTAEEKTADEKAREEQTGREMGNREKALREEAVRKLLEQFFPVVPHTVVSP